MSRLVAVAVVFASAPAAARPGFYIGAGLGGTSVSGEEVAHNRLEADPGAMPPQGFGYVPTTDMDGGIASFFHMGFNILGYAAVETMLSGHGHDLSTASERSWAAHWHTGLRLYPLWHWQAHLPEVWQPFEPSLFLGWGLSYQGYAPPEVAVLEEEVAWEKWGSFRFGLGTEYFLISYFKVGLHYNYVRASYRKFIFDAEDSETYEVKPPATTGFHQVFVVGTFQFGAPQEAVRYPAPAPATPTPTPAPEPEPVTPQPEPEPVTPQPEPAGIDTR